MKKFYSFLIAAILMLAIPMGMMGQTRTEVTYDFSEIPGFDQWGSSYSQHIVEYDDATVTFTSANKNTQTITDIPVTKGQPVSLVLNETTNSITSATFVCRQWGTKAQTITLHYSTDGGTNYTSTNITSTNFTISSSSLPEGTNAVKITFSSTSNQVGIASATINIEASSSTAVATAITIDDTNLTNTDVYVGTEAGSLSATVAAGETTISGATVTWTSSDEEVATINANGVVTLVAAGTTTITAAYAGVEGQYLSSSVTYTLEVTDSAPFTGGDVTFIAGTDVGSTTSNANGDEITKLGVTVSSTSAAFATAEYRIYSGSTTTISTDQGTITQIVFTKTGSSYNTDNLSTTTGSYDSDGSTGTWTGNANSIAFSASAQVRLSQIVVTVDLSATLDPVITAENVNIAYDATSGEIAYTLNNPATNGNLSVSENVDWISNPVLSTTESKVTFTTTANQATTSREGIVTITYTYGNNETVSKDVSVTQAAAPVSYTTIPDMFAAATTTETNVLVTFNNWVVSGVSSNGKNVFVTDNNGNGFVIFYTTDMSSTFAAGNILSGTAVSCSLKKYNGFAELLNVTATDLTITSGGTVTAANVALADLAGVNTGALVHYENLTCSITNSKYYLSDGTTTLQVYGGIYDFGTLVEGKTYNITGVYQQYNNTKEILPRSAADIEEVEVQHEEYTLTVSNLSHVNLFIFGGEESETIISTEDGQSTAQVYDGTEVLVSIDVETGYVFQSLTITNASGTPIEPEELTANEYYKFTMPTSNVTITATAVEYVAPTGETGTITFGNNGVKITTASQSGQTAVDDINNTWTITTTGTTSFSQNTNYSQVGKSTEPATSITFTTTLSGSVIFTSFEAKFGGFSNTAGNITLKVDENTVGTGSLNGTADVTVNNTTEASGTTLTVTVTDIAKGVKCYYISYTYETAPTPQNFTLDIDQYTSGQNGWYLIASPVSVDLSTNTMVSGTYDLYRFNPTADLEWENYKNENHSDFTTLEVGRGYLYANGNNGGIQLSFTGTPANNGEVTAAYTGWNLVGNPLSTAATVDRDYYRMNDTHTGIMTDAGSGNIAMMEGVFVEATANETITFTSASKSSNRASVVMNLSQNRGGVIDRAIVRFNDDRQLSKFQLFENSTKLCIAQNGEEFAIASAEAQGEMPVNFKAAANGTYTISINTENVEMGYLHLIDNLTGNDVDLLATPSYTFEANTADYASRFRLVFSAGNADSDNFAFVSNGQIVLTEQGNAQVYDITGRMVNSYNNVNYISTEGMTAGVYVLQLVNGSNVKTQKIVVK